MDNHEYVKLLSISKVVKGRQPEKLNYSGKNEHLYLNPDYLRGKGNAIIAKPAKNSIIVNDGEIIVLWDGSNAGEFFKSKKGIVASTMAKIEHSNEYKSSFLFYALKLQESYLKGQTNGSGIPHVDQEVLLELNIMNLDRIYQCKIAEVLETVDSAIEKTEELIAKQERIKTGLMQDLLAKGIDEYGNIRSEETHEFKESPIGRIPEEWKTGSIENYVVKEGGIKPGPFGSSLTKEMYVPLGYKVYGQEQVIRGSVEIGDYYITERKFKEMTVFSVLPNDVLISLVGTIGSVLVVPEKYLPGIINPRLLRFRPKEKTCIPQFLKVLLLSNSVKTQLANLATGGTMDVISAGVIKKLTVVHIEKNEQDRIIHVIKSIEQRLLATNNELRKLISIKTGLMQDLLTGKKRVTSLLDDLEVTS